MNIPEIRDDLRKDIKDNFEQANKLWFEFLSLIITLSSSCLLITLALADKLFPNTQNPKSLSVYLIISWVLFFSAIVFSLVTKANEIIFFGNYARDKANALKAFDEAIKKGEDASQQIPAPYYINNTIGWGVFASISFLLAILALCLAFLEKFVSSTACLIIFLFGVLVFIFLIIHLIKKRKT